MNIKKEQNTVTLTVDYDVWGSVIASLKDHARSLEDIGMTASVHDDIVNVIKLNDR